MLSKIKSALNGLVEAKHGAINIVGVVVSVVMVTALVPVIVTFIAEADNLTTTEETLLGLTTLFIILGLIYGVIKASGLGGNRI